MKEFIKKYWWIVLIIVLIPVVVFVAFAIMEFVLHRIDLKAGEWAAFIGAILGYISTAFLGTLALWQNYVFKQENDSLNKKLMQAQIFSNSAFYKVGTCRALYERKKLSLSVFLKNIGKSVAVCTIPYEFELSEFAFKGVPASDKLILGVDKTYANISPNEMIEINMDLKPNLKFQANKEYFGHLTISIVSENQMQYDQVIQMKFMLINKELKFISEYPTQFLKLYD